MHIQYSLDVLENYSGQMTLYNTINNKCYMDALIAVYILMYHVVYITFSHQECIHYNRMYRTVFFSKHTEELKKINIFLVYMLKLSCF